MQIQTRYRDIPFEEIGHGWPPQGCTPERWDKVRGLEILIDCPPANRAFLAICDGPTFVRVNPDGTPFINDRGKRVSVCSHIAEIGD